MVAGTTHRLAELAGRSPTSLNEHFLTWITRGQAYARFGSRAKDCLLNEACHMRCAQCRSARRGSNYHTSCTFCILRKACSPGVIPREFSVCRTGPSPLVAQGQQHGCGTRSRQFPTSRAVHGARGGSSASPQCLLEVSLTNLPCAGDHLGAVRRAPLLHAACVRSTAGPSPVGVLTTCP